MRQSAFAASSRDSVRGNGRSAERSKRPVLPILVGHHQFARFHRGSPMDCGQLAPAFDPAFQATRSRDGKAVPFRRHAGKSVLARHAPHEFTGAGVSRHNGRFVRVPFPQCAAGRNRNAGRPAASWGHDTSRSASRGSVRSPCRNRSPRPGGQRNRDDRDRCEKKHPEVSTHSQHLWPTLQDSLKMSTINQCTSRNKCMCRSTHRFTRVGGNLGTSVRTGCMSTLPDSSTDEVVARQRTCVGWSHVGPPTPRTVVANQLRSRSPRGTKRTQTRRACDGSAENGHNAGRDRRVRTGMNCASCIPKVSPLVGGRCRSAIFSLENPAFVVQFRLQLRKRPVCRRRNMVRKAA